ncbi:hypothetical protein BOTBODRAFT_412153 [Botryobasidium botryosum FD-172 SS1]|uniref:Uncharacterized protein n=1 Tax=Botryobasidium botryosum (strain FD-172 SS1) TaxID=930990 RepID=A0A067MKZ1_BOTB1|nr:hypothetical protein BOTBODRAFT_412153 [Botryobasidium botryosum FD-172 SS1]
MSIQATLCHPLASPSRMEKMTDTTSRLISAFWSLAIFVQSCACFVSARGPTDERLQLTAAYSPSRRMSGGATYCAAPGIYYAGHAE